MKPMHGGILLLLPGFASGVPAPMPPAPHYTQHVLIQPSNQSQTRTIQVRPDHLQCWAIAHVRPDLRNVRCYDVVTLQLAVSRHRGPWTDRYASIRHCVARLTPQQLQGGCVHAVEACAGARDNRCPPAWTSQTSVEFKTNGRVARKEWITCGVGTWHEFRYRLTWCDAGAGLPPIQQRWLSAGDDYEVRIPHVLQVGTEERMTLRPDGALVFDGCC